MNEEVTYQVPQGHTGRVLKPPNTLIVSFPFLQDVRVDAVLLDSEGATTAFLFDSPQRIAVENIIYPEHLGYFHGELLTCQIDLQDGFLIHFVQPVKFNAGILGVFTLDALTVDNECRLVSISNVE